MLRLGYNSTLQTLCISGAFNAPLRTLGTQEMARADKVPPRVWDENRKKSWVWVKIFWRDQLHRIPEIFSDFLMYHTYCRKFGRKFSKNLHVNRLKKFFDSKKIFFRFFNFWHFYIVDYAFLHKFYFYNFSLKSIFGYAIYTYKKSVLLFREQL